jgi:hypothetical protein
MMKEIFHTRKHTTNNDAVQLLIPLILALLIFTMAARTPLDSDMWWHLRAGTTMIEDGRPLLVDQFSFTRDGASWINHSWLSEVILALLYRWMGYPGLALFVAFLATASLMTTYIYMQGHPIFRSFLILLGVIVSAVVWSPRPQIISLVLLALVGYIHYLYKWQQQDKLWLLPVIFLFWGNLHGGFAVGFIFLGTVITGEVFNRLFGSREFALSLNWNEIFRLILWSVASWGILPVNPNGFAIWKIPFQTVGVTFLQNYIQEWASPNFHEIAQQPMLWLLLIILFVFGLNKRRVDGADLAIVVSFAYMALLGRRHMAPFSIVSLPIIARYGWPILLEWHDTIIRPKLLKNRRYQESKVDLKQKTPQRIINLSIIFLFGFLAVGKLVAVSQSSLVEAYAQQQYPVEAVKWINENYPDSNIFSEYEWGGFLTWQVPESKVFLDGRTDLFGDEINNLWLSIISGDKGWNEKLDQYEAELILIYNDRPWNTEISLSDWKEVYRDQKTIIYLRLKR